MRFRTRAFRSIAKTASASPPVDSKISLPFSAQEPAWRCLSNDERFSQSDKCCSGANPSVGAKRLFLPRCIFHRPWRRVRDAHWLVFHPKGALMPVPTPAAMRCRWRFEKLSFLRHKVWVCQDCGEWTANPELYRNDVCRAKERRRVRLPDRREVRP